MEGAPPTIYGLPHQLQEILNSVGIQNLSQSTWSVRCTPRKIFVDISWNRFDFKSPAQRNRRKPDAHRTSLNSSGTRAAVVETRHSPRKPKKKSPSARRRDKLRFEKFSAKNAGRNSGASLNTQADTSPTASTTETLAPGATPVSNSVVVPTSAPAASVSSDIPLVRKPSATSTSQIHTVVPAGDSLVTPAVHAARTVSGSVVTHIAPSNSPTAYGSVDTPTASRPSVITAQNHSLPASLDPQLVTPVLLSHPLTRPADTAQFTPQAHSQLEYRERELDRLAWQEQQGIFEAEELEYQAHIRQLQAEEEELLLTQATHLIPPAGLPYYPYIPPLPVAPNHSLPVGLPDYCYPPPPGPFTPPTGELPQSAPHPGPFFPPPGELPQSAPQQLAEDHLSDSDEFDPGVEEQLSDSDSECGFVPLVERCFNIDCRKRDSNVPGGLKRCTRCHTAAYCSKECQTEHWNLHKPGCAQIASMQYYPQ